VTTSFWRNTAHHDVKNYTHITNNSANSFLTVQSLWI